MKLVKRKGFGCLLETSETSFKSEVERRNKRVQLDSGEQNSRTGRRDRTAEQNSGKRQQNRTAKQDSETGKRKKTAEQNSGTGQQNKTTEQDSGSKQWNETDSGTGHHTFTDGIPTHANTTGNSQSKPLPFARRSSYHAYECISSQPRPSPRCLTEAETSLCPSGGTWLLHVCVRSAEDM